MKNGKKQHQDAPSIAAHFAQKLEFSSWAFEGPFEESFSSWTVEAKAIVASQHRFA